MQQEPKVEEKRPDLEHGKMPDPEAKAISCLFDQIRVLEKKIEVNDSFFYAEMVLMKAPMMEDPFVQKLRGIIKMKLFNC